MQSVPDFWHRRYELTLADGEVFATVKSQFWATSFDFYDSHKVLIGGVHRRNVPTKFKRGFGLSLVSETIVNSGSYVVHMDSIGKKPLSLDQRAVMLAFAVNQDEVFFSPYTMSKCRFDESITEIFGILSTLFPLDSEKYPYASNYQWTDSMSSRC